MLVRDGIHHLRDELPLSLHVVQRVCFCSGIQTADDSPGEASMHTIQLLHRVQQKEEQGGEPLEGFLVLGSSSVSQPGAFGCVLEGLPQKTWA